MNKDTLWKIITAIELVITAAVIILDLFIPTIIILGIIVISLLIRREKISILGFKKNKQALGMVLTILLFVIIWSLLQLSLFMPILNHLTGATQDLSAFENLKGNLGNLLFFLALTCTLAAFGEEIVGRLASFLYFTFSCRWIYIRYKRSTSVQKEYNGYGILEGPAHG